MPIIPLCSAQWHSALAACLPGGILNCLLSMSEPPRFSIDTLFYVYSVYEVGGHHASVSVTAAPCARARAAGRSPKKQSNVEVFYGLYYCFPC